jgi:catechol 2,3-dioxygenase-like lactoylglutathione lyase family enzyme
MITEMESLVTRYDRGDINRRQLLAALAAIAAIAAMPQATRGEEEKGPAFEAKSLNHVTLSVSDIQKSKKFYESILGITTVSKHKDGINLGLGDSSFLGLYSIDKPPRIHHFCVGLDEYHVQVAAERLRQYGIVPFVSPGKPEVYFQDPDGIIVQLESKDYRG